MPAGVSQTTWQTCKNDKGSLKSIQKI